MDTKDSHNPSSANLAKTPIEEDTIAYVAVKGSLHANDCSVFGLGQEEVKALSQKYPGSGNTVVNGFSIKTNALDVIKSLSQLGYKIISSTGEAEITWTMQREF